MATEVRYLLFFSLTSRASAFDCLYSGITIKFQNFLLICRTIKYLVKSSGQWARQVAIVANKIEQSFYCVFPRNVNSWNTEAKKHAKRNRLAKISWLKTTQLYCEYLVVEFCDWSSTEETSRSGVTPKSRSTARTPNKATHWKQLQTCENLVVENDALTYNQDPSRTHRCCCEATDCCTCYNCVTKLVTRPDRADRDKSNTQNLTTVIARNKRIGTNR